MNRRQHVQHRSTHDDAVGQVFSLLIGGVVLLASVGTIMAGMATMDAGDPGTRADTQSSALATMLVDSAGIGWDAANGTVVRLGIAQQGGGGLETTSLAALRGANLAADAENQVVDYEEAKASLRFDGWDFRVTLSPIGLKDELAAMDLGSIRTGYIGAWTEAPSALVADDGQRVPSARTAVDAQATDNAVAEREALVALGLGYDDHADLDSLLLDVHVEGDPPKHLTDVASSAELQGDVHPDQKQYLSAVLPDRISQYDLLVIGSDVQHNALTSDAAKEAVRDWVMGGGTLLVLGSDSQSTQWLQPLFHVGTTKVNGGVYAPHSAHPMLSAPNSIEWSEYDDPAKAWDIRDQGAQAHEDDFDHVIMTSDGDLLAVSRPGAFGDGSVLLTSYQPGELAAQHGLGEGQAFMHNMIVFMDRSHLYLEYGAVPPAGAELGQAVRHSLVHDEALGPVAVRIHVLVWREA